MGWFLCPSHGEYFAVSMCKHAAAAVRSGVFMEVHPKDLLPRAWSAIMCDGCQKRLDSITSTVEYLRFFEEIPDDPSDPHTERDQLALEGFGFDALTEEMESTCSGCYQDWRVAHKTWRCHGCGHLLPDAFATHESVTCGHCGTDYSWIAGVFQQRRGPSKSSEPGSRCLSVLDTAIIPAFEEVKQRLDSSFPEQKFYITPHANGIMVYVIDWDSLKRRPPPSSYRPILVYFWLEDIQSECPRVRYGLHIGGGDDTGAVDRNVEVEAVADWQEGFRKDLSSFMAEIKRFLGS